MNITRNNYEEFFMLYADNELPADIRKDVEAFVAANPDLREELALFSSTKLTPDYNTVFTNKEVLLRDENATETISLNNYEDYFILYADNELSNTQKEQVEVFVYHHPQLQAAFELMQEIKLQPDNSIVFENKEILYRKEEDDKVVPFRWWRIAAAAIVLLIAGLLWTYMSGGSKPIKELVKNNQQPVTNPQAVPLHIKEENKNNSNKQETTEQKENLVQVANQETIKEKAPKTTRDLFERKKIENELNNSSTQQTAEVKKDEPKFVSNTPDADGLKASAIPSIQNKTGKKPDINTDIAAAASKSVKNQQLVYTDAEPAESNKAIAEQAVASNTSADKVEVLNTSVDTKSSLRGFFRKASRLIAKKNSNDDEDSKHKSILIGGFEIAVR